MDDDPEALSALDAEVRDERWSTVRHLRTVE